jgi:hypothetical protein
MERYVIENPHKHYIAVVDTFISPGDGNRVICYNKSAGKQLTISGAKKLAKKLNDSWNGRQQTINICIESPMDKQLNLF